MKRIMTFICILFFLNGCASNPVPEPDPTGLQKKNMSTEDKSTLKIYKK
jgi:PBP1b-binding outer membrane lipoprotein LpoB